MTHARTFEGVEDGENMSIRIELVKSNLEQTNEQEMFLEGSKSIYLERLKPRRLKAYLLYYKYRHVLFHSVTRF